MPVLTKKTNTNPSHSASHHDKGKESFFGVQAKLNIGKSNDKYEAEADRVADQVVSNKQTTKADTFFSPSPVVQKKLAVDVQKREEQNKKIQRKTIAETITPVVQLKEELIQNKLDSRVPEKREINPAFSSKTLIQHKLEDKVQKKEETIQNKTVVKKPETTATNTLSLKPLIQNKGEEENVQQKKEDDKQGKDEDKQIQKSPSGDANPSDNSNLESNLNSSKGGGSPLSGKVKTEMESGIGADFSKVRIHNDSNAVQMNKQLGAQAFATGNNIYFNEGKYNPNSKDGKHLLAHELTHTVQQGAAIRRKPDPISPAPEMIQGSLLSFAIPDFIKNNVRHVPGYTLLTVVAGYDPLNDVNVERNAINLIEGFMGLIPFGTAIFDKLQEYGIIDRVFNWVNTRLGELGLSMDSLLKLVQDAWDESSVTTFIDVARTKFNDLVNRVTTFATSLVDQVITWIKEALIGVAEPLLAENKAWSLIKKIIKYDPLRDVAVNATTVEILEDFLILIDKQTELEQMREKGTLQKTADWLDTQVGTFNSLLGELRGLITAAWNAIQPANLANIGDSLSALASQAGTFLQKVWDFASGVALKVLELVKDSLLGWLSSQAATVRGYSLVKVIIGKDPFTKEVVPRTIPNLIRGFMSLMDGGEEQYAQMVESGAIARIAGEVEAAVAALNMTPESIVQLFTDIWDSMTINDLIHPIDAFLRIIDKFGEPIGRLIAFVAEIVRIVIIAILEIMNFPFDLIGNIITRALEAIEDIKKDPIGFLKNILRALKQGFIQFFDNIVTHLINGVTGWLMSELKDANIPVLTDFSLRGVIAWVLEVLNISMEKIWEKLAAHPRIGPARVARLRSMINTLEGIWTFIKDVQERGMAAIWDKIQEQLSNLWNTVLDAVKNFVMERIVNRITAKLLSMLDPTGIMAVINGAMAFFNAIQSFIKYLREMLEVVNSFVNGVADLARGNVATAANYLERTMGQAMPVVIGFLANQVGLTGIGARIGEMIISVQQMVDEALTWLVNKAVDTGMNMLDRLMAMGASVRDAILGWLGLRKEFVADNGENHTLYFTGDENAPVLTIASNPIAFTTFITSVDVGNDPVKTNSKAQALIVAGQIDAKKRESVAAPTPAEENANSERKKRELEALLIQLSNHAKSLFGVSDAELPESVIDQQQESKGGDIVAKKMTASILTKKGPAGSEPTQRSHAFYDKLAKRKNGGSSYYIRGHLLNHNTHGPGTWENMTPLSREGNSAHEGSVESLVKAAVQSGAIVFYSVEPKNYIGNLSTPNDADPTIKEIREAEQFVPRTLDCKAVLLEKNGNNYTEKAGGNIATIPVNNPVDTNINSYEISTTSRARVSIINSSIDDLVNNTIGIRSGTMTAIQNKAKTIANLRLYSQIKDEFPNIPENAVIRAAINSLQELSNVVIN
ncbi:uncharacterized protein DUF4157 [Flavobacterium sp. 90]|uniref:phage tail protein n=1 Tax=unclassified Flavobacterium TaxID=196869 RepID=UPI000F0FF5E4|nr:MULTISPECIES: DUF4157 domain-containing protein [unclassified Flavobacterium]RKR05628.1 uncharacterized protein DUF4157 [Flavobacterium sp. 81]TCK56941.1 uncharacterized protein DUF4157 [Flavobacterium sp. 90]